MARSQPDSGPRGTGPALIASTYRYIPAV